MADLFDPRTMKELLNQSVDVKLKISDGESWFRGMLVAIDDREQCIMLAGYPMPIPFDMITGGRRSTS